MRTRARITAARDRAQRLIEHFQIRDPSEILVKEMAISRGAAVFTERLNGHLGQRVLRVLVVDDRIQEPGRQRFTLAHEFGHYELHEGHSSRCSAAHIFRSTQRSPEEREANAFASELLMPTSLFVPLCGEQPPELEFVGHLSQEFQTSLTATAVRVVETSAYPCALFMSTEKGKILWSKIPRPFYRRKVKPRQGQVSALSRILQPGAELWARQPHPAPVEAWFEGASEPGRELLEQSTFLRSYGKVLTMVWWLEPEDFQEAFPGSTRLRSF